MTDIYCSKCGYKRYNTISSTSHATVEIGDTIILGHYEQDNNASNKKEPIEWTVLDYDAENNKALLISHYGLDVPAYNTMDNEITWEKCTLRTWLNQNFLDVAFTSKEKSAILTTSVDNSSKQGYKEFISKSGNNTQDKIFVLSYHEAFDLYFHSDHARVSKPTAYAVARGAYESSNGSCWWLLRSPGSSLNYAAGIFSDGLCYSFDVVNTTCAIRPAFWLNLSSDIF